MYWVKTPAIIKSIFPSLVWNIRTNEKILFITFDDGPDENITPRVLDILDEYKAKATFFCVGEKAVQNKDLYQLILKKGHTTGNHAYNHLNGYHTSTKEYLQNIARAAQTINSPLFRPPYGKLKRSQLKVLKKDYQIIMWDVLTGDFDPKISKEKVLQRAIRYSRPGSIIVFHDNEKFKSKMIYALRGVLEHFSGEGYRFLAIPNQRKVVSLNRAQKI